MSCEPPKIEQEWAKFEAGIVGPDAAEDVQVMARLAYVCGFQIACLVIRESGGDQNMEIFRGGYRAFLAERVKWAERMDARLKAAVVEKGAARA